MQRPSGEFLSGRCTDDQVEDDAEPIQPIVGMCGQESPRPPEVPPIAPAVRRLSSSRNSSWIHSMDRPHASSASWFSRSSSPAEAGSGPCSSASPSVGHCDSWSAASSRRPLRPCGRPHHLAHGRQLTRHRVVESRGDRHVDGSSAWRGVVRALRRCIRLLRRCLLTRLSIESGGRLFDRRRVRRCILPWAGRCHHQFCPLI
jgi:hypothetical protein